MKLVYRNLPEGIKKTMKNPNQDSRSLGRDFKPTGVLTTRPLAFLCSLVHTKRQIRATSTDINRKIGPKTGYPEVLRVFHQSLRANAGIVP
jgi:hypothetical protein